MRWPGEDPDHAADFDGDVLAREDCFACRHLRALDGCDVLSTLAHTLISMTAKRKKRDAIDDGLTVLNYRRGSDPHDTCPRFVLAGLEELDRRRDAWNKKAVG